MRLLPCSFLVLVASLFVAIPAAAAVAPSGALEPEAKALQASFPGVLMNGAKVRQTGAKAGQSTILVKRGNSVQAWKDFKQIVDMSTIKRTENGKGYTARNALGKEVTIRTAGKGNNGITISMGSGKKVRYEW